jgi:hypothetical protein
MATPYNGVSDRNKDAYNFFHSQVHITIEWEFGMVCHFFRIICKAVLSKIRITKATAMVYCLCRLHKFCIDSDDTNVPKSCNNDLLIFAVEGGIQGGAEESLHYNSNYCPEELLDGGHHQNNFDSLRVESKLCYVQWYCIDL